MASELNINVSQSTLDKISEKVGDRLVDELKNIGDDGQLLLKKIALDFITQVQKNLSLIQQAERNALLLKQKRESIGYSKNKKNQSVVAEYQKYKEKIRAKNLSEYSFDSFFESAMRFNDQILQVITGHEARIAIVIPSANGEQPLVLDIPLSELFSGDTGITIEADMASGKIPRLSGRLKFNIDQMKNHFSQGLRQDSIIGSISLRGLNQAYDQALVDYRRHKPYAFWYVPPVKNWFKIKIGGGEGDISEAYAFFFYAGGNEVNPNTLFLGTIYNENLAYFFREGVAKVDNISGLYTSDVSTKEFDYAVKSVDASLPGFRQMIDLATKILNGKIKTKTELQTISLKKQYKDYINKVGEKGVRNVISEVTADQLKEFDIH